MCTPVKVYVYFSLLIFSSIHQSFSAVFWLFLGPQALHDYTNARSASVYNGVLFSLSPADKRGICRDVFSAQLYVHFDGSESESELNRLIHDGVPGESEHGLVLDMVGLTAGSLSLRDETDLYFECVAGNFRKRKPFYGEYYHISSASRPGWFLVSNLEILHVRGDPSQVDENMLQSYYFSLSPEYVRMEQAELEQQYMNIRATLKELENESPAYGELIERNNDLSSLTRWQKLFLCATILSAPIYRTDRLEFWVDWIDQDKDYSLDYRLEKLSFKTGKYPSEIRPIDCILCKGFRNASDKKNDSTNLFLVQSSNNKHSLYVLKEENEGIYLSKYFKNISVLRNANDPLKEGYLLPNFTDD